MKKVHVNDDLWVTVKVERGFPGEVKAFFTEKMALKQERTWRKQMNLDYDDTGVFKIKLSEINTTGSKGLIMIHEEQKVAVQLSLH